MCESCVEKSAHKVGAGTSVSPDRWFTYDVVAEDPGTHARAGVLHTPHGDVQLFTLTLRLVSHSLIVDVAAYQGGEGGR